MSLDIKDLLPVALFFLGLYFGKRKMNLEVLTLEDNRLLKWREETLQISDKLVEEKRLKNKETDRADRAEKAFEEFKLQCKCQPNVTVTIINNPPANEPKLLNA